MDRRAEAREKKGAEKAGKRGTEEAILLDYTLMSPVRQGTAQSHTGCGAEVRERQESSFQRNIKKPPE